MTEPRLTVEGPAAITVGPVTLLRRRRLVLSILTLALLSYLSDGDIAC
jgi:hypothetical protein